MSKTHSGETGGIIEVSGGKVLKHSKAGCPDGTYTTVSNLFFNTPARAKFLKKPKTEESEITNLVSRFILANPDISFKYTVEGKTIYQSGAGGKEDAIFAVYGNKTLSELLPFNKDFGGIAISGYIGKPSFTKPNKTYQTLIVNGRYVINSVIASAVHNAYGEFLMKRQFPFYIIYLNIPHDSVDVNVHPNKLDIRFENSGRIYASVFEAVARTLAGMEYITSASFNLTAGQNTKSELNNSGENLRIGQTDEPKLGFKEPSLKIEQKAEPMLASSKTRAQIEQVNEPALGFMPRKDFKAVESTIEQKSGAGALTEKEVFSGILNLNKQDSSEFRNSVGIGASLLEKLKAEKEKEIRSQTNLYQNNEARVGSDIKRIGKIFNTYLILEYMDAMFLIDQHAGHERILYDKFKKQVDESNIITQTMLIPFILSVNSTEFAYIEENSEVLKALGFDIEQFGKLTFKISSFPLAFEKINFYEFFNIFLKDIKNPSLSKQSDYIKEYLMQTACKSAIKGGDDLSNIEIETLLRDISKDKIALCCPHGRPIIVRISKTDMEKWFKRIV